MNIPDPAVTELKLYNLWNVFTNSSWLLYRALTESTLGHAWCAANGYYII